MTVSTYGYELAVPLLYCCEKVVRDVLFSAAEVAKFLVVVLFVQKGCKVISCILCKRTIMRVSACVCVPTCLCVCVHVLSIYV